MTYPVEKKKETRTLTSRIVELDGKVAIATFLLRQKFSRVPPEHLSVEDCVELMLEFAEHETQRADAAMEAYTQHVNVCNSRGIL